MVHKFRIAGLAFLLMTVLVGTASAAPGAFNLLTPADATVLTEVPASLDITWEEATTATGYTFDLDRPVSANVVLADLTPAADADALTCAASVCTLSVADASTVLTENGAYSWTVVATDGVENTPATNNPFTFTVDVPVTGPEAFDLLSPADDTVLTSVPVSLDITWSEAVGATTYTFDLDRPVSANVTIPDLTPADDADALTCAASVCTLSIADASAPLSENGFYSWTVVASNESGDTPATNNPFTFVVAADVYVPAAFDLLSPANGAVLTELPASLSITWEEADGAATYTFDLDRPTSENVTLAALTPAADADGLACATDVCTLTVSDVSGVLTDEGIYSWTVSGTNTTGTTAAANNPFTFEVSIVVVPGAFSLISPANNAVVRDPATVTAITWGLSADASSYNFVLFKISDNTRIGVVLDLDIPAENCGETAGVCTLPVDEATQALLTDGTYSWTVVADSGESTTEATNGPFFFTVSTGPIELVENGGFEAKTIENAPDLLPWVGKNLSGDKIKCNKETKLVAHTGECAFLFKGSVGENSKIQQNLDTTQIFAADTLTLNLFANTKIAAAGKVAVVKIKYSEPDAGQGANGKDKLTIELTAPTLNETYEAFSGQLLIDGTVTKAKLQLTNKNTAGKVYIDDVTATMTTGVITATLSSAGSNVIPLP